MAMVFVLYLMANLHKQMNIVLGVNFIEMSIIGVPTKIFLGTITGMVVYKVIGLVEIGNLEGNLICLAHLHYTFCQNYMHSLV